jgi:hypothetical protein
MAVSYDAKRSSCSLSMDDAAAYVAELETYLGDTATSTTTTTSIPTRSYRRSSWTGSPPAGPSSNQESMAVRAAPAPRGPPR